MSLHADSTIPRADLCQHFVNLHRAKQNMERLERVRLNEPALYIFMGKFHFDP